MYDRRVGHGQGVAGVCIAAAACVGGGAQRNASGVDGRESERLEREGEKEQTGEEKNMQEDFCKYLTLATRGMPRRLQTLA